MKCKECRIEFQGCLRDEDIDEYQQIQQSSLIKKPCTPNSAHKRGDG